MSCVKSYGNSALHGLIRECPTLVYVMFVESGGFLSV